VDSSITNTDFKSITFFSMSVSNEQVLPSVQRVAPSLKFLKRAVFSPATGAWVPGGGDDEQKTRKIVGGMLDDIEANREAACLKYARDLDGWKKDTVVVSKADKDKAISTLSEQVKQDVQFQYERVRDFALAQADSLKNFETELYPGVVTGQRIVPVGCAGCYIPGGTFSHVSSAIMTIATAKASGVETIVACSAPFADTEMIHPATLYAMHIAGADHILCLGGVQAIAAMAHGLFTNVEADVIVGPGNKFVMEAKRSLFGRVGIDMLAGPTEILILADKTADPLIVATDLIGQAEHGIASPAWLITTDRLLGEKVIELMKELVDELTRREPNSACGQSWRDYGEVVYVETREQAAKLNDLYAPEHLEVHADDLDWWLKTLRNYGSLFLGEETCVTYGDKCTGPNHVLPTKRVARYSGGLSADKFLKKLTYQRMTKEANKTMGVSAARISRIEGMEGHAMAGDARLAKYYPNDTFDISSTPDNVARTARIRAAQGKSKL
jgi:sulfopropanediol 3-dehydrogenase